MKKWIVILLIAVSLAACRKRRMERRACTSETHFIAIDTCRMFVPNIFTPNGDGVNDIFKAYCNCPVDNYKFSVQKRNDDRIFISHYTIYGWDGTYEGSYVKDDAYIYSIEGSIFGVDINLEGEVAKVQDVNDYEFKNCQECILGDQFDGHNIIGSTTENLNCK